MISTIDYLDSGIYNSVIDCFEEICRYLSRLEVQNEFFGPKPRIIKEKVIPLDR